MVMAAVMMNVLSIAKMNTSDAPRRCRSLATREAKGSAGDDGATDRWRNWLIMRSYR